MEGGVGCGILRFCDSQCFSGIEDPLNFPESGWWGRILSAMKVLLDAELAKHNAFIPAPDQVPVKERKRK